MTKLLVRVYLNGDKTKAARGQPLSAGISGKAALEALRKLNGAGGLKSPFGSFISNDDKDLEAGDYNFISAQVPRASEFGEGGPSDCTGAAGSGTETDQEWTTAPKTELRAWLEEHRFNPAPSLEDCRAFLSAAPVSKATREAISDNLLEIAADVHLDCGDAVRRGTGAQGYFERLDVRQCLLEKGDSQFLMLHGRRRHGKIVSIPHEAVMARHQVHGTSDRVAFYFDGQREMHIQHLQTALAVLSAMRIPVFFDEFTTSTSLPVAKKFKIFMEGLTGREVDKLTFFLFGSAESEIQHLANKFFRYLAARGAGHGRLPTPSINLLAAIHGLREPELKGCPRGLNFLRRLTVHGENLSEHMNRELPEDPITFLIWLGASGITYEDGQCLAALEKVLDGDYKDVSFTEKFRLIGSGIVSELPTCSSLQLMDPALIALQGIRRHEALEDIEGHVLEALVRAPMGFLPQLLEIIGFPKLSQKEVEGLLSWTGSVCTAVEVDAFISLGKDLLMISAKRQHDHQHWNTSFLKYLDSMRLQYKQLDTRLQQACQEAITLHLVAVSAGAGSVHGTVPSIYSLPAEGPEHVVQLKQHEVFLHELLNLVEKPVLLHSNGPALVSPS